jgi:PAS domain S-box-containing protein
MAASRVTGLRRLGHLLQRMRDPMYVLDARGRLAFVNRAWEALTGRSAETVLGQVCGIEAPASEGEDRELRRLLESLAPPPEASGGQPIAGVARLPATGGATADHAIAFWPVRDGRGSVVGQVALIRTDGFASLVPESPVARLRADLEMLRARARARDESETIVGQGAAHQRLLHQIQLAAGTKASLVIWGELGTGRRTVARAIVAQAAHGGRSLEFVDCEALSASEIERVLFDTHAVDPASAQGRVLLLAEVAAVPRELQERLARTQESHGLRLLATLREDPESAHDAGRLHAELYFRLTSLVVRLAPLRERRGEIGLLAQAALERLAADERRAATGFSAGALGILSQYDWPGNLAELERVVRASAARAAGELIQPGELPGEIQGARGGAYQPPAGIAMSLDQVLATIERRLIERALARSKQNKSRAAEWLQMSRPRLYRRISELGIPDDEEEGIPLRDETISDSPPDPAS